MFWFSCLWFIGGISIATNRRYPLIDCLWSPQASHLHKMLTSDMTLGLCSNRATLQGTVLAVIFVPIEVIAV